jgi:hypothetical protein
MAQMDQAKYDRMRRPDGDDAKDATATRAIDEEMLNPSDLSDEELREEIEARLAKVTQIELHLVNDAKRGFRRGSDWRVRANSAIVHFQSAVRELQGIQNARITMAEQKAFHEKALEAKREVIRLANERQATQESLFVQWFRTTVSKDELKRAWDQVRAMFPDHPVWSAARQDK